jgi:hypothetical protein
LTSRKIYITLKTPKAIKPTKTTLKHRKRKMSLQNALSDAQIERMETALYEILASSGRKFADKISYTVTRFGTIYLEATINDQTFERRIEWFVKSEDQIVYNIYTSTGKMYSWGEPCDLEGVLSLAGMDQEIVDGFEADILGL